MAGTIVTSALLILVAILQLSIRRVMSTNQEKLNTITTQLGVISERVTKGLGEVSTKIDALKNQAPESLDFTSLERTVDQLKVAAEALDGIVPDEVAAEDPNQPMILVPAVEAFPAAPEAPAAEVPSDTGTESTEAAVETPTETDGASRRTTSARKK